jgi:hypothetical protein
VKSSKFSFEDIPNDPDLIRLDNRLLALKKHERALQQQKLDLIHEKDRELQVILKELDNLHRDFEINRKAYLASGQFENEERHSLSFQYEKRKKELEGYYKRIGRRFDAQKRDLDEAINNVREQMKFEKKEFKKRASMKKETEREIEQFQLDI